MHFVISIRVRGRPFCYKVCQWLSTGWWFSPGPPVSSTNKTEVLLKVALNHHKSPKNQYNRSRHFHISVETNLLFVHIPTTCPRFILLFYKRWSGRIPQTTKVSIHNLPFFFQLTKIDTHKNNWIHSNRIYPWYSWNIFESGVKTP
jgi:hypothetical protein